ncbi:helix-turn-helix domain-containing protein [Salinarimonas sp. NSM]|uniref:helix-turn-helix domain-containing protein n=1 Tax=Salinarimonas sp. NSM TaxID=3458003 RepID=UPI004036E615
MAIARMTLDEALAAARDEAPGRRARLAAVTDEEIERRAHEDDENPPWTDEELARGVAGRRVRLARERDGLSQAEFARRYCLTRETVEALEDGALLPDPALDAYLRAIEADPDGVRRSLAAGAR